MNEHEEMNNNINTPTDNAAEMLKVIEENTTPKKRSAKTTKRIILGVGLPILALVIIFGTLFLTLSPSIALQNTLESFGINKRAFTKLEQKFQSKGVCGYYNIELPFSIQSETVLYTIRADVNTTPDKGNIDILLSGNQEKELSASLVYCDDFIALKNDGESYYSIPLENFKEMLDASIFHPDSSSKYALSPKAYDSITAFIEGKHGSSDNDNTLYEETFEAIEDVLGNLWKCLKTEDRIVFSKEPFGLCKKVEYTLNKETLTEFCEYLATEIQENESLAVLFASIEKEELIEALKSAPESFEEENSYKFSYLVHLGKIKNITFSSFDQSKYLSSSNKITLDFEYGSKESSIKFTSVQDTSTDNETGTATASAEIVLDKNENTNTYTFTFHGEDGSTPLFGKLIHNTYDGKFSLNFGTTEECEQLSVEGNFLVDSKSGKLRLALSSIVTEQMNMDWEIIDINLNVSSSAPDTDVETTNILTMSEKEFGNVYKNIPVDEINDLLNPFLGGKKLFDYTYDKIIVFNPDEYVNASAQYQNGFITYLNDKENDPVGKCNKVYVYDEKLDVYFLISYDTIGQRLYTYTYKKLTPSHVRDYHEATMGEGYDDMLEVHQLTLTESKRDTCNSQGTDIYHCSRCEKDISVRTQGVPHTDKTHTVTVKAYDGKEYEATVTRCTVCNRLSVNAEDYFKFYIQKQDGKFTLMEYTTNYLYPYLYIPEETLGDLKLEILDIHVLSTEVEVIQIPNNIKLSDNFPATSPQILILPSSIEEIESRAFGSLEDLHTVYYHGTPEDWKKVKLNEYESIFNKVDIYFVDEAPSPETIKINLK